MPSKLLFALWQEMVSSTVVFKFHVPRDFRDYNSLCCSCKEEDCDIVSSVNLTKVQ